MLFFFLFLELLMADTVQEVAGTVQAVAAVVNAGAEVAGIIPKGTFISQENVKDIYKELKEQLDSLRSMGKKEGL